MRQSTVSWRRLDSKETALAVGLRVGDTLVQEAEESLSELSLLAVTAGAKVAGEILQSRPAPHVRTYIGSGKLEEVRDRVRAEKLTAVLFDDELSPSQQRNVEKYLDVKVLDRTALILDIFAKRAHTAEGKLQVELAQLSYLLPRLRGKGVELSRLAGGIGTRGPGETKLESDRRRIQDRISKLKGRLKGLSQKRGVQRKSRKRGEVATVSLVGYTNAGKSSLLNVLTKSDVGAANKLFATLDPTARKLRLPSGRQVVMTDTVGFIRKLPHQLVSAFQSTLDEVREADLLLHVMDVSSSEMDTHAEAVESVLSEIGAADIPRLDVLNKVDKIHTDDIRIYESGASTGLFVSAKTKAGLDRLLGEIESKLPRGYRQEKRG